jgi:hypothetical protein
MENKFVDGLFINRRENAPDFLISSLSFNEKFIEYLKSNFNAKGWCNIDVLKSKEGKLYAKLNDWKTSEKFVKNEDGKLDVEEVEDELNVQDIPF